MNGVMLKRRGKTALLVNHYPNGAFTSNMKKKLKWIGVFIVLWCIVLIIWNITQTSIYNKEDQANFQIEKELLKETELYWDDVEKQREMDSIDDYMRYWYEVLDTNSNGDIDDTE